MATPVLTIEQRREALKKAAAARAARAEVKVKLKDGSLSLKSFLEQAQGNEAYSMMRVVSLLESLPGVGPSTAQKVMEALTISPTRRVRGLGRKQVAGLLERYS